jgi:signal transduction histidine kinase
LDSAAAQKNHGVGASVMEVPHHNVLAEESEKGPPWATQSFSVRRTALLTLLVGVGSYVTARLGGTLGIPPQGVSALWPGCALLASVLLLVPRRIWPALIPAGFAGFVVHDLQAGFPPLTIALLILADTIEILIVVLGLRYCFNGIPQLNSLKALAKYLLVAVLLGPLIGTFVGAFAIRGNFLTNWQIFFFSEAMAFLIITPAFLSWAHPHSLRKSVSLESRLEGTALIGTVIFLGTVVFFIDWRTPLPVLPYSLVPVLLWAALRFGSKGVSTSMIVIVFASIWGRIHGSSPFTGLDSLHYVLSLQLFWVFAATPFMVLATLVEERERARLVEKDLSRRLTTAQEQERIRIARELHDDICQRLSILSLKIEKVTKGSGHGQLSVADQLEQIWQQCSSLAGDVQALSHELHPTILDNLGLATAVKSYCREVSEQSGVVVEFYGKNIPGSLPQELSLSVFRVVQESLRNAVKYSGQKRFEVRLQEISGQLELEVTDQGVGFDLTSAKDGGGLGLVSMAERIYQVNGTFSIDSQPNAGTRIRARVPLAARSKAMTTAAN